MNRAHSTAFANWHPHFHRYAAEVELRDWLTDRNSLTARLVARCGQFRVQRLQQQNAPCLPDEFAALGLPGRATVVERDVLLRCDEVAVVYAHTVLPLSATASQWPRFAALGNKSLGSTLFLDPLVTRGNLQYAQLRTSHPLMRRIRSLHLLPTHISRLFARRSLFTRHGSSLLVTEVFLPGLSTLPQASYLKVAP
jgi:chorismate--pyruvate lyase